MINIQNVSKHFDSIKALDQITADIGEGQVFGLIGTNGAGKSTLMRAMCGVLRPDEGSIIIDDQNVYENPTVKSQIFYISDDQYFFNNGTPAEMLRFYSTWYPSMDVERFNKLLGILELDPNRKINTFSKGMKKQLSVIRLLEEERRLSGAPFCVYNQRESLKVVQISWNFCSFSGDRFSTNSASSMRSYRPMNSLRSLNQSPMTSSAAAFGLQ